MPVPAPNGSPRPGLTPLFALIITVALIGGWLAMWLAGLFQTLGNKVSLLVLAGDLAVIAVIWFVAIRRDLDRRR